MLSFASSRAQDRMLLQLLLQLSVGLKEYNIYGLKYDVILIS